MRFCDLGPLQIEVDGVVDAPRGRRLTTILGTLLLHLNRRVSVDVLLDAVWAGEDTVGSTGTLESHVWRLRRMLEPNRARGVAANVLINDSGGYRLVATPTQVDSARFEQLGLDVLDLLTTGQPDRALQAAEQALALWRGDPFADLADQTWAIGPIARLREIRTQLQERRIDAIMAVGRSEQAVAELEPLIAEHPFRERLWWQRMLALYRYGRTEDALTTYRTARRTLLDEVGLEPGPDLVELQRRILDQDPALRPEPTRAPPRQNRSVELRLPRARPVVGRGRDMHSVGELLKIAQLVTVAGAAGCGKTLLAIEVARLQAEHYPDGVRFVDLSATQPDAAVAEQIAGGLDLAVPPGATALTALIGYATDRRALVVLDNCEQILNQVADLAEVLTEPGSQIGLLVTSREPLGIAAEEVYVLGPLAVDRAAESAAPLSPIEEPAVALFAARARLSDDLPAADLTAIRGICRAVDGIPLAIELAAALVSTFSLAEIADQVERDPGQLAAIGRGQAHHHQTLTSAIERSHRLLSHAEQVLHRRLSVLPGTFSRDLAEAVVSPELRPRTATLLARLVHRSLLTVSPGGGTARFAQLAPIRAHAVHALRAAGEIDLAAELRDGWVQTLVLARPVAGRPEEADWYGALHTELATVRATLHRRLIERPDSTGSELTNHLIGFWYYQDLLEEGIRWAEEGARRSVGRDLPGVMSRLSLANLLVELNRADRARALVREALGIVDQDGSAEHRVAGQAEPLSPLQRFNLAELLLSLASAFTVPRDTATMRRLLDFADGPTVRQDTDLAVTHEVMHCMADAIDGTSDLGRVQELFDRADALQNLWAAWMAAACGASIGLMRQDPELGLSWSRRVIDRQARLGAKTVVAQVETYGDFLALDGRLVPAARIFAAAHHQARQAGRGWPRNALTTDMLDRCRKGLSTAEFDAAWAIGPTLDRDELTAESALE